MKNFTPGRSGWSVPIWLLLGCSLCSCTIDLVGTGIAGNRQGTVRASNVESTVDETGACEADLSLDPAALRARKGGDLIGSTECEVVAVRGRPQSLSIRYEGETRLVTLRYETGERVNYLFRDNRLVTSVRPAERR